MSIEVNDMSVIKSTVDKWGLDIAVKLLGATAVALDLDDRQAVQERLSGVADRAIVWKILDLSATNIPGVKNLAFALGSAVRGDNNNINSLSLAGYVEEYFCVGKTLGVLNYLTTTPPTEEAGRFAVRHVDMNPQVSDAGSEYRLVVVEGFYYRKV